MQLIVCWIVFPLLLGLIAYGCGSVAGALAGVRLGSLAIPVGLAVVIAVLDGAVRTGALRELAVPIVIGLAATGLVLAWPFQRPALWPIVAGVAAFLVFAAPIVLTGHTSIAGYIKLDDTATFLALTDRVFAHGPSYTGLPVSSYERTLFFYFGSGYPFGSTLPLGLGKQLLSQDIAWLFDPLIAFFAGAMALSLERIAAAVVRIPWQRALIAVFAAQPALLYGYAMWGGIKEIAAAVLLATFVAAAPRGDRLLSVRAWIPAALVMAAMVAAETVGGLVWLLPVVAGAGLLALSGLGIKRLARSGVLIPVAILVGALAISLTAGGFLEHNLNVLRGEQELGNLIHPLNGLQILGIWPTGDFRFDPKELTITHILVAIVALAGIVGVLAAFLRRGWPVVLYIVAAGLGALVITVLGSPWLGGKALATASPAFVLCALVGAAVLAANPGDGVARLAGHRVEAGVIAVAVCGGVLWSNVLAYHEVNLAPHAQLSELEDIGNRIAGQGPALMTEYMPYGVRHFLRAADPEGASELRYRQDLLRNGQFVPKGGTADINEFALSGVLVYRSLVLRRSPEASRPPAPYQETFAGRYYEVWQRPLSGSPSILGDLPLGGGSGAVPSCADVAALAKTPGIATIAAAPALDPAPVSVSLDAVSRSPWPPAGGGQVELNRGASVTFTISVPITKRYAIWVGGSGPRAKLSTAIDGVGAGSARNQLQYGGEWTEVGSTRISAGSHRLTLRYSGADWRPGSGGGVPGGAAAPTVGPLQIAPDEPRPAVVSVAPSAARSLCGRRLYWVEALGA